MANEIRSRTNLVSGTLSSSLTNVATSMSAAGLANLAVIDTTNYAAITIENEIVWVTAHTGGATTATILRAQEGTSAVAHNSAVAWQHGPTAFDLGTDWTSYTPTLGQGATTNITKTVTYARYQRIGRLIVVEGSLAVTGTGTASAAINVTLPTAGTTAAAGAAFFLVPGAASVFDTSASMTYPAFSYLASTTTLQFTPLGATVGVGWNGLGLGGGIGTGTFGAALANGDVVSYSAIYESLA